MSDPTDPTDRSWEDELEPIRARARKARGGALHDPWEIERRTERDHVWWVVRAQGGRAVATFYDEDEARFYAHAGRDVAKLMATCAELAGRSELAAHDLEEFGERLREIGTQAGAPALDDPLEIAKFLETLEDPLGELAKAQAERTKLLVYLLAIVIASGGEIVVDHTSLSKARAPHDLQIGTSPQSSILRVEKKPAMTRQPITAHVARPTGWPDTTGSTGGSW